MSACRTVRTILGVYVVGAIDPADRQIVDLHVAECRSCRDELAGLAGLPALLGRVTEEQITQAVEATPGPLDRLVTRAARDRRTRRHRSLLAAAALVAVTASASAGVTMWRDGPDDPHPVAALTPTPGELVRGGTDPRTGVHMEVAMTAKAWGSALRVVVTGLPDGAGWCRLIAVDQSGRRDPVGSWQVSYQEGENFLGSTWIALDKLDHFELVAADGANLLMLPRA